MVIRKNRNEKGIRVFFSGSNPHSNGESLSWSSKDLKDKMDDVVFRIIARIKENNISNNRVKIIYS
jgi:hypothetical protein